jgi:putative FmdB family regulatory protein
MPIFEFRCDRCGKEFERIVLSSGEPSPDCPVCGCTETKKILSVFTAGGGNRKSLPECSSSAASGGGG